MTMRDKKRSPLVTSILILNSLLLGVMVIALLFALAAVSLVVDQEVGGYRSVTECTQWVFDHTPRNPFSMISVAVGVIATSLFFSLAVPTSIEREERTANCGGCVALPSTTRRLFGSARSIFFRLRRA